MAGKTQATLGRGKRSHDPGPALKAVAFVHVEGRTREAFRDQGGDQTQEGKTRDEFGIISRSAYQEVPPHTLTVGIDFRRGTQDFSAYSVLPEGRLLLIVHRGRIRPSFLGTCAAVVIYTTVDGLTLCSHKKARRTTYPVTSSTLTINKPIRDTKGKKRAVPETLSKMIIFPPVPLLVK
ncbi:hypothetical protein BGW80DRAFT_1253329 [Lactifluus volemus]|nr:hypothetical protein BGW80DRAFT_1253329 [Lactifluus volemus]